MHVTGLRVPAPPAHGMDWLWRKNIDQIYTFPLVRLLQGIPKIHKALLALYKKSDPANCAGPQNAADPIAETVNASSRFLSLNFFLYFLAMQEKLALHDFDKFYQDREAMEATSTTEGEARAGEIQFVGTEGESPRKLDYHGIANGQLREALAKGDLEGAFFLLLDMHSEVGEAELHRRQRNEILARLRSAWVADMEAMEHEAEIGRAHV